MSSSFFISVIQDSPEAATTSSDNLDFSSSIPSIFSSTVPLVKNLPDPEGTVGCLVFNRRIPPTVKMDDMVCFGQIKAHAARLQRQDHKGDITLVLEFVNDLFPFSDGHTSVQDQPSSMKNVL
jgi:hypothetical protein